MSPKVVLSSPCCAETERHQYARKWRTGIARDQKTRPKIAYNTEIDTSTMHRSPAYSTWTTNSEIIGVSERKAYFAQSQGENDSLELARVSGRSRKQPRGNMTAHSRDLVQDRTENRRCESGDRDDAGSCDGSCDPSPAVLI